MTLNKVVLSLALASATILGWLALPAAPNAGAAVPSGTETRQGARERAGAHAKKHHGHHRHHGKGGQGKHSGRHASK